MADERDPLDDLKRAWQAQPSGASVDVAEVRRKAEKFRRTIHRRNLRELFAVAFLVLAGGYQALTATSRAMALAGLLLVVGVLSIGYRLIRDGSPQTPPQEDAPTASVLAFHRGELERQARLLRSAPVWYVGPMLPSVLVVLLTTLLGAIDAGRGVVVTLVIGFVIFGTFALVIALNRHAARRLDAQARELQT